MMQIAHGDECICASGGACVHVHVSWVHSSALTSRDGRDQAGRSNDNLVWAARRYLAPPAESIICFRSASIG
jgi:hypothetical protein